MAIKSLKNKITNLASGEILGETTEEEKRKGKQQDRQDNQKSGVVRKPKKEKPSKERKVSKDSFFKRKEISSLEETSSNKQSKGKPSQEKIIVKEAIDGYEDVLSILNIKENINLDIDFESKDMDYIQFTQTTPLGFDFDEVTDFISRMKYTLHKYETALKQRNRELVIVASEVKKVEQKMVEQNQAKELEKMIGGMTEEERLIEENMDLKVEINNLKTKLINQGNESETVAKLQKEIKALRAENEMLIRREIQMSTQQPFEDDFKLPNAKSDFKLPKADTGFKLSESELNTGGSKGKPLPTFNLPSDIQMPTYEEEDSGDNFLDSLMKDRVKDENSDSLDDMIKNMGGEYDE